jgi:hypothetical protein
MKVRHPALMRRVLSSVSSHLKRVRRSASAEAAWCTVDNLYVCLRIAIHAVPMQDLAISIDAEGGLLAYALLLTG